MTIENVWPAGEPTSLQKKKFSETEDSEPVPLSPSKQEHHSKKNKRGKVDETDKRPLSYTKAP